MPARSDDVLVRGRPEVTATGPTDEIDPTQTLSRGGGLAPDGLRPYVP